MTDTDLLRTYSLLRNNLPRYGMGEDNYYYLDNWNVLRSIFTDLKKSNFSINEVIEIQNTIKNSRTKNELPYITDVEMNIIDTRIASILKNLAASLGETENENEIEMLNQHQIKFKLPEVKTLDDLIEEIKDVNMALNRSHILPDSKPVDLVGVESGSVILNLVFPDQQTIEALATFITAALEVAKLVVSYKASIKSTNHSSEKLKKQQDEIDKLHEKVLSDTCMLKAEEINVELNLHLNDEGINDVGVAVKTTSAQMSKGLEIYASLHTRGENPINFPSKDTYKELQLTIAQKQISERSSTDAKEMTDKA